MTAQISQPLVADHERDFRDPEVRLSQLLDSGTILSLCERDRNGVYAVRGRVEGKPVIAYCTDGTIMGRCDGCEGMRRHRGSR